MSDCCQPETTRRQLLARAGAGGALVAALLLGDDQAAEALAPTFETIGLGEERVNQDRLEAMAAKKPAPTKKASPTTKKASTTTKKRAGVSPPRIVTRAEWGADESLRRGGRKFLPVRKIVVHHTASPSNPKHPEDWVRMTYRFHTKDRGYSDVGYNFLIDHRGTVYEGRWARDYPAGERHSGEDAGGYGVMGAHALGVNAGTCGIVLLGDFSTTATGQPTSKAVASLVQLVAWLCARHEIDPLGTDRYVGLNGAARTFPNIAGHRDVGVTGCPGGNLYQLLPTIRRTVAKQVGRFPAFTANLAASIRYGDGAAPSSKPKPKPKPTPAPEPVVEPWTLTGFRVMTSDGRLAVVGKAPDPSPTSAKGAREPVAIARGAKQGFYVLDSRSGVLAFGGATWLGSTAKLGVASRAVDLETTPAGDGYWVLTEDGGVYGFGAARHFGSPKKSGVGAASRKLRSTPTGKGYWVLTADGVVLPFGDAPELAPVRWKQGASPVDLAVTPTGRGYWLLAASGAVVARGDAAPLGGMDTRRGRWAKPAVAIAAPRSGAGYTILTSDGTVAPFGKVSLAGSAASGSARAVGLVAVYA